MPPTDESPRGSIANLINRFENQTKRAPQSGPLSISSRSSSVVSQTSSLGDSLKEDAKERKEWPPKSASLSGERPSFVMPSYLRPNVGTLASTVASSLAATSSPPAGPPVPESVSQKPETPPKAATPSGGSPVAPERTPMEPTSSRSSTEPDSQPKAKTNIAPVDTQSPVVAIEVMEEVEPETPKPGALQRKASASTVTAPTPAAAVKPSGKTPVTAKAHPTAKPVAVLKAPTKSSSTPKPSLAPVTPLKPQHTGNSVASTTTGSSRKPVSKPTPATPSRAKTPLKPSTTAVARARSPFARAKTPSTGLYAPTAASLARSRYAPPLPQPTPVKKVLSSEVAERLSKPTAASLSKVRAPAAAGVSSPRPSFGGGTPVKKTNAGGTPVKTTPIRKSVSSPAIRKASPASARAKAAERALSGSGSKDDGFVEAAASVPQNETDESVASLGAAANSKLDIPAQKNADGAGAGNDIEDIVNLLQFVPVSNIPSLSSEGDGSLAGERRVVSPDEVQHEIPDEE